jgi:hypothetical protein
LAVEAVEVRGCWTRRLDAVVALGLLVARNRNVVEASGNSYDRLWEASWVRNHKRNATYEESLLGENWFCSVAVPLRQTCWSFLGGLGLFVIAVPWKKDETMYETNCSLVVVLGILRQTCWSLLGGLGLFVIAVPWKKETMYGTNCSLVVVLGIFLVAVPLKKVMMYGTNWPLLVVLDLFVFVSLVAKARVQCEDSNEGRCFDLDRLNNSSLTVDWRHRIPHRRPEYGRGCVDCRYLNLCSY